MPMISDSDLILEHKFVFSGTNVLVRDGGFDLPGEDVVKKCLEFQLALDWFSEPEWRYTALNLESDAPRPAGCRWVPIREFFASGNSSGDDGRRAVVRITARARSLLNWRRAARYCGSCGGAMHDSTEETARKCIVCGRISFPAIEPAIIVLVEKDGKILLAKHANRNTGAYTCIAGFVEQGESIEDTVRREVREETGIEIQNARYMGSQSWPFPNQLMLGFRAEWKSGEPRPDKKEIEDIQWFSPDNLPQIPPKGSIAWNLIMNETWPC
jgi:NAD+ diphosphatase